jgi:hypothetical protein
MLFWIGKLDMLLEGLSLFSNGLISPDEGFGLLFRNSGVINRLLRGGLLEFVDRLLRALLVALLKGILFVLLLEGVMEGVLFTAFVIEVLLFERPVTEESLLVLPATRVLLVALMFAVLNKGFMLAMFISLEVVLWFWGLFMGALNEFFIEL